MASDTPSTPLPEQGEAMNTLLSDEELLAELGYIEVTTIKDHRTVTKYRHCTGEFHDLSTGFVKKLLDLINTQKRLFAESIINEPSDTVKKGDTAFTALEKFRAEQRAKLEGIMGEE